MGKNEGSPPIYKEDCKDHTVDTYVVPYGAGKRVICRLCGTIIEDTGEALESA